MAKKMKHVELSPEMKMRIVKNAFEEWAFEEERRAIELAANLAEKPGPGDFDPAVDGDFGNWMEAQLAEAQR